MSLSPQFLDELRARTLLSSLIGKTVKLQKAGREFRACCPFHNEKTPSFYVNDDKGFYHCFGCSAHGDAIRWLTDQRGLPFIDAVKELVQAAGMEMPEQDRRAAEKAERAKGLHETMADAAAWFTERLNGIEGADARAVLERRGIKPETARKFGLGFSPDSRGKLKEALKSYGDDTLVEAGLLIKVEDREPYDRFRGRLMIPIRDVRGRTVAFGGRVIGDGEPKYLNSPDTPLFDKGRTLYNLDRAQAAARKTGRVIVVEGYMDVIALGQAGFDEVVAPLGTALTEHQLERLWRMAEMPILAFDGDTAGQKAAIRAAHRALPMLQPGRRLALLILPRGQDPDDVVSEGGAAAFDKILKHAIPLDEYIWRSELAGIGPNPGSDERGALLHRLNALADTIADSILREQYRQTFRNNFYALFGLKKRDLAVVRDAVASASRHPGRGGEYALYRAVLLGLMRYPMVLYDDLEAVSRLPIIDRYLRRWRDILIDIAVKYPGLTEDVIDQILSQSDVSPIEKRNLRTDLAFSFFRKLDDMDEALRDLHLVIEVLNEHHETTKASNLAQRAFEEAMAEGEAILEELFATQQRTKKAASASQERLYPWLEAARAAASAAQAA